MHMLINIKILYGVALILFGVATLAGILRLSALRGLLLPILVLGIGSGLLFSGNEWDDLSFDVFLMTFPWLAGFVMGLLYRSQYEKLVGRYKKVAGMKHPPSP